MSGKEGLILMPLKKKQHKFDLLKSLMFEQGI